MGPSDAVQNSFSPTRPCLVSRPVFPCVKQPERGSHLAFVSSQPGASPQLPAAPVARPAQPHPGRENLCDNHPDPRRSSLSSQGLWALIPTSPAPTCLFSPGAPPVPLPSLWTVTLPSTSQRKTDLPRALPQPDLHPAKSLAPLQGSREAGIISKTTPFLPSPPCPPGGPRE